VLGSREAKHLTKASSTWTGDAPGDVLISIEAFSLTDFGGHLPRRCQSSAHLAWRPGLHLHHRSRAPYQRLDRRVWQTTGANGVATINVSIDGDAAPEIQINMSHPYQFTATDFIL
jgi:hypothetical protein